MCISILFKKQDKGTVGSEVLKVAGIISFTVRRYFVAQTLIAKWREIGTVHYCAGAEQIIQILYGIYLLMKHAKANKLLRWPEEHNIL